MGSPSTRGRGSKLEGDALSIIVLEVALYARARIETANQGNLAHIGGVALYARARIETQHGQPQARFQWVALYARARIETPGFRWSRRLTASRPLREGADRNVKDRHGSSPF